MFLTWGDITHCNAISLFLLPFMFSFTLITYAVPYPISTFSTPTSVLTSIIMQKGIGEKEVKKTINKLQYVEAAGVAGITAEMSKFGGEPVLEWMGLISDLAWKQKEVPDE